MRSIPVVLFGLLILFISCKDDDVNRDDGGDDPDEEPYEFAVETGNSVIPYIVIDTDGAAIKNEPKISALMDVYVNKERLQRANIGIEYRGSTSFRLSDKKSYGIETWDEDGNDVDVSFFDFPKEEDWILQGHIVNTDEKYVFDRTLMYHYTAYELSRNIGQYASRSKFVEFELNKEYLGIYVFMEKLKRDNNRIDIANLDAADTDITGGYILKIDKSAGGDLNLNQPLEYFENNWEDDARYMESFSFRSQYDINGDLITFEPYRPPYHPDQYLETYFLYEDPAPEDITQAQKDYIQDYIYQFETALLNADFSSQTREYLNYINLPSFVDFFIMNELCRNIDGYRLSTYLYKDREGRLSMGPIWDFNIAFDNGGRIPETDWVINYNQYVSGDAWMMPFWWPRLMEDPIFREAVKVRWTSLRSGPLSTSSLLSLVDNTASYLESNGAVERNYEKWDQGIGIDFQAGVNSLKGFLEFRAGWMDDQIANF